MKPWRGIIGRLAQDIENPYTPPAKGIHLRRIWLDDPNFDKRLRAVEFYWNGDRIGTYIKTCDEGSARDCLNRSLQERKREAITAHYRSLTHEELVKVAVENALSAT